MPITRRDALAAAVGCGLTANAAAAADDKPAAGGPVRDTLLASIPNAPRKVVEDFFPNHFCVRLVTRGVRESAVYRATLFHPGHQRTTQFVGGEEISTPKMYEVELDARGKVLEETTHPIEPSRVPKVVAAAYDQWNPKGVQRMVTMWSTEVAVGKGRVYRAYILVSAVKAYAASFKEDGTVLAADPTDGR